MSAARKLPTARERINTVQSQFRQQIEDSVDAEGSTYNGDVYF